MDQLAAAGATVDYIRAAYATHRLAPREEETARDWGIRLVRLANEIFPEKEWREMTLREEDVAKRVKFSVGLWLALSAIAEAEGGDAAYYRKAYERIHKAAGDTDYYNKKNYFIWCCDMGRPLYKRIFEATREGIRVLTAYAKTGKLVAYDEALLVFPTKWERFFG